MKMYEFIIDDLQADKTTSVFYSGSMSLAEVAEAEYRNSGNELVEDTTLKLYFDPKIIDEYYVAIVNDNQLYYELGLADLVEGYRLYKMLNEKFNAGIPV